MGALDIKYLQLALDKARESVVQGGFPSGAVIVKDGKVIAVGLSIGNLLHDPTSHGEGAAIRAACAQLQTSDLSGATLYTCLCPCVMCLGAALWSGLTRIVYACPQEVVSVAYYGGSYRSHQINSQFQKPMELVHISSFEEEALALIKAWEKQIEAS